MAGMNESQVVRIRVPLHGQPGKHGLGSGYVIAEGLVLTAAHVLEKSKGQPAKKGDPCEVLPWQGTEWLAAEVGWVHPVLDVAAVKCAACQVNEPVRWGQPKGAHLLEWMAIGYPRASLVGEDRNPEQAFGRFGPLSGGPTEIALTIESRDAADFDTGDSGWAGLSGAAIFSGDHLIGVMVSDPGSYERSLVGRRALAFFDDPKLVSLLEQAPTLEEVLGDSPEPGLDLSLHITIRDQGQEGSVVGMAVAVAMEGSLAYQGGPMRLSARYAYAKARHLENPRNWEDDGGAQLETGLKVAERFGLPLESAWPYVSNQTALPGGETWKHMDTVRPRYKARLYPIVAYDELPYHLLRGRPVITGVEVYAEAWYSERVTKTGWVEIPHTFSVIGGHAIVIVGYDAAHDALKFANSWGDHWGDRGFGYLDRRVVERSIMGFQEQGGGSPTPEAVAFWAVEVPLDARHCLEVDDN